MKISCEIGVKRLMIFEKLEKAFSRSYKDIGQNFHQDFKSIWSGWLFPPKKDGSLSKEIFCPELSFSSRSAYTYTLWIGKCSCIYLWLNQTNCVHIKHSQNTLGNTVISYKLKCKYPCRNTHWRKRTWIFLRKEFVGLLSRLEFLTES